MTLKTRLTFAEAAAYQASFDAVEAGTATEAQAQEVRAVMEGFEHLRAIGAKAGRIIDNRTNLTAMVPADKRDAFITLMDDGAAPPRIRYDEGLGQIGTADEIAAEKTRLEEAAAAKAAEEEAAAKLVEADTPA